MTAFRQSYIHLRTESQCAIARLAALVVFVTVITIGAGRRFAFSARTKQTRPRAGRQTLDSGEQQTLLDFLFRQLLAAEAAFIRARLYHFRILLLFA